MSDQITYRIGAQFNARGNLAAKAGGMAKSVGDLGSKLAAAGARASAFGDRMLQSSTAAAIGWAKVGAAVGSAAFLGGAAAIAKAGFEGNVGAERLKSTVAGTLQLFNHSAGAADQLGTNIKVAEAAMMRLNDIADSSPGELKDVQQLFQDMLPGARAVTGDMQRILDLTKSAAVFTPTFGGDFGMAGSQLSRILTGGAGAEMETWKILQVPILKAGQAMDLYGKKGKKVFGENQAEGEKLTQAFNKLSKVDRLNLVEASMKGGADDLAKMYSNSWEGASASAVSAGRKVSMAFTAPIFGEVKKSLIRAGSQDNSLLGKNRINKMIGQATAIGALMAKPVGRMLDKLERGIRYFQDNFGAVFNRMYQVMQVGAGLLRAAFAFGLAKMMAGAAITAASGAVRAGRGLVGGARSIGKNFNDRRKRVGDGAVATGIGMFFSRMAKGNPLILAASNGFLSMGIGLVSMIPMLLIAAAALALFAIPFLAIAGIAAYVASKWEELSASIVKGFQDGSITIKPLVIAVLVLWERLKKLGEAFIGGQTGATMMQKAINMATSIVNGLSEGVAIMANVAAGMLTIIGKLANAWQDVFGETDNDRTVARHKELMGQGMSHGDAAKRAWAERENGFHTRGQTVGDDAQALANKLSEAAKSWRSVTIDSLDTSTVDSWTDWATKGLTDMLGSKDDPKDKPKGVSIGTAIIQVDLRNTDPDRMMVGLIDPIKKATKQPDSSSFDMGGF
jgi:uncharacterized protein YoaH (UPF0181 family)